MAVEWKWNARWLWLTRWKYYELFERPIDGPICIPVNLRFYKLDILFRQFRSITPANSNRLRHGPVERQTCEAGLQRNLSRNFHYNGLWTRGNTVVCNLDCCHVRGHTAKGSHLRSGVNWYMILLTVRSINVYSHSRQSGNDWLLRPLSCPVSVWFDRLFEGFSPSCCSFATGVRCKDYNRVKVMVPHVSSLNSGCPDASLLFGTSVPRSLVIS